jgi:hypothetical protein
LWLCYLFLNIQRVAKQILLMSLKWSFFIYIYTLIIKLLPNVSFVPCSFIFFWPSGIIWISLLFFHSSLVFILVFWSFSSLSLFHVIVFIFSPFWPFIPVTLLSVTCVISCLIWFFS